MSPRDFCYWLQGYIEIAGPIEIGTEEVRVIKEHLDKVFKKEERKQVIEIGGYSEGTVPSPDIKPWTTAATPLRTMEEHPEYPTVEVINATTC